MLNDHESRFLQAKLEIYGLYRLLGALHLYLIGVCNLVIEVDAHYIKGMLKNPDIAPNSTINCWILSILTFHFTLIHVPGSHHGPDDLSRCPVQIDDTVDDPSDFEDWIDQVHNLLHIINPYRPHPIHFTTISTLVSSSSSMTEDSQDFSREESGIAADSTEFSQLRYQDIPQSQSAILDKEHLELVRKWHEDLQQPAKLSDLEYKSFLCYCIEFFIDSDKFWRKDSQGVHKIVAPPELRIKIMATAHDDIGHKSFYAMHTIIFKCFWWPNMQSDIHCFVRTCHICQL
jgi:hypothetical protein